jgi:cbb3-type cytochrome oxidase cytochrome c subunit
VLVRGAQIEKRYPSVGGDLAKYLLPRVVAREQQVLPTLKGSEAWGWLPPPLMGEGSKVQSEWLHNFLLDPHKIRPATVLRMPKFNMSSDEATKLVNYFAARDDAEYPYMYSPRRRSDHLQQADARYQATLQSEAPDLQGTRLEHALKVVTNGNYCVQCHIVADFEPTKEERGKGPNLAEVYKRLRPDYTRQWLAKPWSILPYTGMPVNFKYDPDKPNTGTLVPQTLYHGDSTDQLDAVLDLIMNFDTFAAQQTRVTPLVKEQQLQNPPETPATGGEATDAASGSSDAGN